ncbi:MAG: fimbrillin family protein [Muribaculaceae bacterium]|nr:fimbrillin family protein [Muribaculaceae bacterium]
MKIQIPLLAIASLMLSACADSDLGGPDQSGRVIRFDVASAAAASRSGGGFASIGQALSLESGESLLFLTPKVSSTAPVSRSTVVDSETIADFGVYASLASTGDPYMVNVEVTRDNLWTPTREYLWPGNDALKFTAYSPYQPATELNAAGEPQVSWQTASDVADQQSLLWAEPVEASASPCAMQFHNALTGIRFVAGSELAPCTVKNVTLSGIPSSGTLNAATGEWSDVTSPAAFTVAPGVTLPAASGSDYVAPGSLLTADGQTFLMIPGTLPRDASISLTLEISGKEQTFTASLTDVVWQAGTTVTYSVSAKADAAGLTLEVIGKLETEYPGQTAPFLVRSALVTADGDSTDVAWTAEFVDADGNTLPGRPDWILNFPMSGKGHDDLTTSTRLQDLNFIKLSPESRALQDAADINQTSGNTPYNLANSTGGAADQNTANCYIINAPGEYSFPLVYGNAIKNGSDNPAAYTSSSHNSLALKTFVNHLGNGITSPYIYQNSGCTPADAVLIWEGRLDLIRNVALSADGKRVTFTVPASNIRQGNAMIAVRDAEGTIMWSWHLWITDYKPSEDYVTYTESTGSEHHFYARNVGRIMGGDITEFPHCETRVKFTQVNVPDGMEPLSTIIPFTQTGITIETSDYYNLYQWGRKDPIKSAVKEWFNADHYEIKAVTIQDLPTSSGIKNYIPTFIMNPEVFYTASHDQRFSYSNLWNSSLSTSNNVKTIYDPCPVGSKVPLDNGFLAMIRDASVTKSYESATTGTGSMGLSLRFSNGQQLFLDQLGYRSGASGTDASGIGTIGTIWLAQTPTAASTARTEARAIVVSNSTIQQNTNPRTHGFGIRPTLD